MPACLNRITYVDDEPDICAVAVLALEKLGGYVVDPCQNGHDALERTSEFHPDLILLDVMMPKLDGEAVLQRLKTLRFLDDTPIAFVTAKAQPSDIERYLMIGANGVIPKPFDPIMLPQRAHHIWRNYHQR